MSNGLVWIAPAPANVAKGRLEADVGRNVKRRQSMCHGAVRRWLMVAVAK